MGIGKKIKYSLLGLAILTALLISGVSIYQFAGIRTTFQEKMEEATDKLYEENVTLMSDSSSRLAESLANFYAQTINMDFVRIMGELHTLKGDIETLYSARGVQKTTEIRRYKEYIISQAADLSADEVQTVLERLSAITPMFDNILAIESKISLAYLVMENGMVISSTDTFYPEVEKADMRTRDWYIGAMKSGASHWSDLYSGTDSRSYVTISIPVSDEHGNPFGVLAFDLRVSEISDKVLFADNTFYLDAFITEEAGKVLLSTQNVEETYDKNYYKLYMSNKNFREKSYGCYIGEDTILGYSVIESTGWILVTILDYDLLMAPVDNVADSVIGTGESMKNTISEKISQVVLLFAAMAAVIIPLVLVTSSLVSKGIIHPIQTLASGAKTIGEGNLDYEIPDLGSDEIGMLASNFNDMTKKLKEYIAEVTNTAKERQRLESELDVARGIQLGMLPKRIDCSDYDIAGMMLPAKEVGGDFYDFFCISENKLCFVAADVSGKGVGAALFMTLAKMVIKTAAQGDTSVEEIMSMANKLLCEENPAELFVTAFVGILELDNGKIVYACAGHNPPIIKKANGEVAFIPVIPRLPLAAMEGISYPKMETKLELGDMMLLYTDGVTEATSKEKELYGDERLLKAARALKVDKASEIITDIKESIDGFALGEAQFDDITIVVLKREEL